MIDLDRIASLREALQTKNPAFSRVPWLVAPLVSPLTGRQAGRCVSRGSRPLPDSPRVGHRWPRRVRGRCPEPVWNHRVGNGGQGRDRTINRRVDCSRAA